MKCVVARGFLFDILRTGGGFSCRGDMLRPGTLQHRSR